MILLLGSWLAAPALGDPAAAGPPIAGLRPAVIDPALESSPTLRRRIARDLEAFPSLGVKSGPILYLPALVVEGIVTDNVRASHRDRIADIGLRLAPSLVIESDWVRHAFRFSGSAERIFYAGQSEFDPTAADAAARLRLDLKGGTAVELAADYDLSEASAGADEVPQSAAGLRRDQAVGGSAALVHDVGRIDLEARAGARAFVYSDVALADGGRESNRDRSYLEPQLSVKAGYGLKPGLKPYVALEYAPRFHGQAVDRNGERRDSQGGAVYLGAVIDDQPLWGGDLALRYERRFYDDPALDPAGIVGLAGTLFWRPSATTTLALTATSGLSETSIAGQSATLGQAVTFGITQLFKDDIAMTAIGGVDWSNDEGGGDLTWTASLDVTWALRRFAALLAGYDLAIYDSADPASSSVENRLSAGLQFRI